MTAWVPGPPAAVCPCLAHHAECCKHEDEAHDDCTHHVHQVGHGQAVWGEQGGEGGGSVEGGVGEGQH
jgi:hypothetical protein